MFRLTADERRLLQDLRKKHPALQHKVDAEAEAEGEGITFGQHISDIVASTIGSWAFIIIQSVILVIWMIINVVAMRFRWDPYPFILLNLVLSFQAAFTAPIIMMSQNRQAERDRAEQQHDFDINIKAELEIEALHQKFDVMREAEILRLLDLVESLCSHLEVARGQQNSQPA
ncbi:MAG: DUF1003 domain-containing protein [Parvibaculaceae bacterium]